MKEKYLISVYDNNNINYIADQLSKRIIDKHNINIVCIGTDICIGDSLGPLIGSILSDSFIMRNIKIIGTLENPVHAKNIDEKILEIDKDAFVIAIDASIGSNINFIEIADRFLFPGKGMGKNLPPVGDLSIFGVLFDKEEKIDFFSDAIRLGDVYFMAKVISQAIYKAFAIKNSIIEKIAFDRGS